MCLWWQFNTSKVRNIPSGVIFVSTRINSNFGSRYIQVLYNGKIKFIRDFVKLKEFSLCQSEFTKCKSGSRDLRRIIWKMPRFIVLNFLEFISFVRLSSILFRIREEFELLWLKVLVGTGSSKLQVMFSFTRLKSTTEKLEYIVSIYLNVASYTSCDTYRYWFKFYWNSK